MEELLNGVIVSINKFKEEFFEKYGFKIDKNLIEIDLITKEGTVLNSFEELNNKEINKLVEKYKYLNNLFDPIINFKD